MVKNLRCTPNIRGNAIDLSFTETVPDHGISGAQNTGLRLVRRLRAYPTEPTDGFAVLELRRLAGEPNEESRRILRWLFATPEPSRENQETPISCAGIECDFADTTDTHQKTFFVVELTTSGEDTLHLDTNTRLKTSRFIQAIVQLELSNPVRHCRC